MAAMGGESGGGLARPIGEGAEKCVYDTTTTTTTTILLLY